MDTLFLHKENGSIYLARGVELFFLGGNNIDFSMNLKHMEWMDNDGEYTLEKENFLD